MNKNITEFLDKTIGGISKNFDGNTIFRKGLIIKGATSIDENLSIFGKANFLNTTTAAEFFEEEYAFDWTRKRLRNKIVSNYGKSLVFVNRETILEADGRLIGTGENVNGKLNVGGRKDIFQVFQDSSKTVILYRNGTLEVVGDLENKYARIYEWRRIVRITISENIIIGLDLSGNVLIAGEATEEEQTMLGWKDILEIKSIKGAYIGLNKNGKLLSIGENTGSRLDFSNWEQITYIDANDDYVIGINGTGSIFYTAFAPEPFKLDYWEGLDFAIAKRDFVLGFKEDGNVVIAGYPPEWLDITKLYNTEYIEVTNFGTFSINYDKETVLLGAEPGFEKLEFNLTKIIELKDLPELKPVYIDSNSVKEILVDFRELYSIKDKFTTESWENYDYAFSTIENLLMNETILEDEFYSKYNDLGIAKNQLEIAALKTVLDTLPKTEDSTLYSPESWNNYETVKTQAENVMGDTTATEEQVEQVKNSLETASSYLVNVNAANSALSNVPPNTDSYKYYESLFTEIKSQEAQLKELVNSSTVTQLEIDTLTNDLNNNLNLLTDISSATAIIRNTESLNSENFNVASWVEFETAKTELETALANEVSGQATIDTLVAKVELKKDSLVDVASYKSFLIESQNNFPDSSSNTYTPASWTKLQTAESNMITEMTQPTTYDELNQALIELQDAKNEIVSKGGGDYWLNKAPLISDSSYYTPTTFNRAITAANALKSLYANPDATQTQVTAAVKELETAITNLVPLVMTKIVDLNLTIRSENYFRRDPEASTIITMGPEEVMTEISEVWACHNSSSATISFGGIGTLGINVVSGGEPTGTIAGVPLNGNKKTSVSVKVNSVDRKRRSGLVYKYESYVRVTKIVIKYIKVKG